MAHDAAGPGEIPTFSGLPHERLEDYERDLKAYVLGTRESDRTLIGPRLLRRLAPVTTTVPSRNALRYCLLSTHIPAA